MKLKRRDILMLIICALLLGLSLWLVLSPGGC